MKVVDKIREAVAACDGDANGRSNGREAVFSFEFFTPRKASEVDGLLGLIGRMVAHGPAFCDLTWRSGSLATDDLTLDVTGKMQNAVAVETMMHLACTNMPVQRIDRALARIKSDGVQNVLALRGDPPHGQDKFVPVPDGFASALELVEHIRAKHGDYFGITVAGYPEGHPDVIGSEGVASDEAYQNELAYLKRKVDAGADLIITQLFFDTDIFLKFVNDCRQVGITCPIVPGIMPIATYKGFARMTSMCKTKIPAEVAAALEPIKHNDEAVRNFGIHLGTEMCRKILAGGIKALHIYTFNKEASALAILMVVPNTLRIQYVFVAFVLTCAVHLNQNLGLIEDPRVSRSLPQRHHPSKVLPVEEDQRPNSGTAEAEKKF